MNRIYRTFRTLALALSLAAFALGDSARGEDGLFTVSGIKVDISAENATKARDEAFLKAQKDAFAQIAARNLPPERLAAFVPPGPEIVGPMIKDFEVGNEKITPTRYIGTYTFRFYAPAVAGWLGESAAQGGGEIGAPEQGAGGGETVSVSSADLPADLGPVLVLPFYQWGSRTILWTDANPWRERWMAQTGAILIPRGDLEDVNGVADTQALTYDPAALAAMKQRYGAARAAILIGVPVGESGMEVYVYDADSTGASGPAYLQTLSVQAAPGQDALTLATRAAAEFLAKYQSSSPSGSSASVVDSAAPMREISVRVRFSNPREWVETQKALSSVETVRSAEVSSLSPTEALVTVTLRGDDAALTHLMAGKGLTLTPPSAGDGVYTLCYGSYCAPESTVGGMTVP